MKTEKWMSWAAFAALLVTTASCDDWGQKDPAAGNQVNPSLENVAAYDFEAEESLDPMVWRITANPGGTAPQVIEDETKGKVLELNNGYVTLSNPLNKVVLQEAASLTFWMMQPIVMEGEGEEAVEVPQDLTSPLISFGNETGNGRLYITANGGINYNAADGEWVENDPSVAATGYLTPGEWHYVAVILNNGGYEWWVDGERKVSKEVSGFDCSKMVRFANKVPYLTIGAPENQSRWMIDDLKIYRNALTEKEIKRPNLGGGGVSGGDDFGNFEYVVGDPVLNVGSPDCTTAWWTEFSNYYRIPANTTMTFSFTNHTSGGGNWNNWNLCLSTDADRAGDGYAEYIVIRSDLYGWGASYNGDNWISEGYGDWDKFRADMEGAKVKVTVTRSGTSSLIEAVATCADGTVYKESITAECGDADAVIRAFFIVDASYLEFDKDGCLARWSVPVNTTSIGAEDCSTGWWTEFSDYFQIPSGQSLHLGLTNYTSGVGNWNNWNLCVSTDAERGGDGYLEYFVIRSDLFGWGESYNGDNWSSEGYDDWEKFRVDMNGAYVDIDIVRSAEVAHVEAKASCADGKQYVERFFATCGDSADTLSAFLIVDGSHLKMNASDCYLYMPIYK